VLLDALDRRLHREQAADLLWSKADAAGVARLGGKICFSVYNITCICYNRYMRSINGQLRDARRARHISQRALGARIGLPQSHVSAIETGKVDSRLSSIIELARQLDQELLLIPRALVPAVRALLAGDEDAPLWQAGEYDEEEA